jgi:hypothetical protein
MPLRNQFRARPVTIAFTAFDVQVTVTIGDPSLRGEISELLPPGAVTKPPAVGDGRFAITPASADGFDVTAGNNTVQRDATRQVALGMLDAQIRLHVAEWAPHHVFVHAGVIARNGRALAIPGTSFSGKTTLVAALLSTGVEYLSDEYLVLDPTGRANPYPRPLSIRPTEGEPGGERLASELGAATASSPAELSGVMITRYRPDATWQPVTLSRARGCLALMEHTIPAQRRPHAALDVIEHALAGATILEGDRGDAHDTTESILERFTWLRPSTSA